MTKNYAEAYRSMKSWNRAMVLADKEYRLAKSRKLRFAKDSVTSNAENLVEKKYRKDKTSVKIPKKTSVLI